ncbi:hypothetical protein V5O48_003892 [Marasmius crinis-equi]|uniref:Tyr recombinase domain-containing protein n=1 Tax=Marasmius crinis-equi TaxID=585013 RepID=A0ABR3FRP5_9AGAR
MAAGDDDEGKEADSCEDGPPVRIPDNLEKALSSRTPIEATPYAIYFYLYHKFFEEDKGKSTAWQIFSAWKKYYNDLDGDKYRGKWHQDRETKEWVGNPTGCAMVLDMLKACQNKDGETDRKHSHAISIEDMKALYKWSLHECPANSAVNDMEMLAKVTEHLHFRAFITLAFNLWTRNSEACNLKWGYIENNAEPQPGSTPGDGNPMNVHLRGRTGWQKKMAKGETQLNGHLYRLYPQSLPWIDAYTHLLTWKTHLETYILKRPVQADDYLFPSVGMGGHSVQIGTPISADTIQKKINEFAEAAGLPRAGRFTTHCFRRGGAQYRFMYAPIGERWTLSRVRWWGGWAPSERRDTLVRDLLDELYTYEEDHSGALCPISLAKNESHLGEAAAVKPLATYEARQMIKEMESRLSTQIAGLNIVQSFPLPWNPLSQPYSQLATAPIPVVPRYPAATFLYTLQSTQPSASSFVPNPNAQSSAKAPHQRQLPKAPAFPSGIQPYSPKIPHSTPLPTTPHLLCIPPPPRGLPKDQAWEQVVRDWEEADPSRGLVHALKDWEESWYKPQQRLAVLFGRDTTSFCEAYPEYQNGLKALQRAILAQQQKDDVAKSRHRGKSQQDPEDQEMSSSDGKES